MKSFKRRSIPKMKTVSYLFILSLVLFSSCKKTEKKPECKIKAISADSLEIEGRWRLMKSTRISMFSGELLVIDYSCSAIVYEFTREGQLSITANNDEDLLPRSHPLKTGIYSYDVLPGENNPDSSKYYSSLVIENKKNQIIISSEQLIVSESHRDGPELLFYRVE